MLKHLETFLDDAHPEATALALDCQAQFANSLNEAHAAALAAAAAALGGCGEGSEAGHKGSAYSSEGEGRMIRSARSVVRAVGGDPSAAAGFTVLHPHPVGTGTGANTSTRTRASTSTRTGASADDSCSN